MRPAASRSIATRTPTLGPALALSLAALPLLGAAPTNDSFMGRKRVTGASGLVEGSNLGATREPGEPEHAGEAGGASIWYGWVAPTGGTATFATSGSSIDSLLAVYTGGTLAALREVASDDDGGDLFTSHVWFEARQGTEYVIAVDGFDGEAGDVVLSWSLTPPCRAPSAPAGPSPVDGAARVEAPLTLAWNGGTALSPKTIYGADDRRDIYEVTDPAVRSAWDSTVALVWRGDLTDAGGGTYRLASITFGEAESLCATERYRTQPSAAWCTGFLVGEDLVATAGHCVANRDDCADVAFLFGYRMLDANTPVLAFARSQVYFCKEVLGSWGPEDSAADWAVLRLDRKVPDHRPLRVRRTGKIADNQALFMIGHPAGLPAKVAGGARVRDNTPSTFFICNLDAYGGNSGSPVFNATTLLVEGILVAGEEDFVESGGCFVTKRCPDAGCEGEVVTRSVEFDHHLPPNPALMAFEVQFGPCGGLKILGKTQEESWPLQDLEPDSTYCWRVTAEGECGRTLGPVWSFTTAPPPPPVFLRGDPTEDGRVDIGDPVAVLFHLFLGQAVACPKSADADDSGALGLEDAVRLLSYLFQGGLPPADPFGLCAQDPTPDGLACGGFAPCR